MKNSNQQCETLNHVLNCAEGGINKRIDENRELLGLLATESPGLLEKFPWISGWLVSQDNFLCELKQAGTIDRPVFKEKAGFPRPMPVIEQRQVH